MSFYIKPPKGLLSLAKFNKFATNRLKLLLEIREAHGNAHRIRSMLEQINLVEESDCLIEGTNKDNISHFILRLACAESAEVSAVFYEAEGALFCYRIGCMTSQELRTAIGPLKRLMTKIRVILTTSGRHVNYEIMQLFYLVSHMTSGASWNELVEGFINADNSRHVQLPFQYVPELVATRQVVVKRGMAEVPYSMLHHILYTIFSLNLRHGLKIAATRARDGTCDDRVGRLVANIKAVVMRHSQSGVPNTRRGTVTYGDVQALCDIFPPCMRHLQDKLHTTHRLPHHARVQYTLFLKELGMPVHEAVEFWKRYYAQPAATGVTYGHDWRTDGRRYTYSVRHLYGMEGARKNYKSHCCASIQESSPLHGQPGGCPFKHFDGKHLTRLLGDSVSNTVAQTVLDKCQSGLYSDACKHYLLYRVQQQQKLETTELRTKGCTCKQSECYQCQGRSYNLVSNESHKSGDGIYSRRRKCSSASREHLFVKRRKKSMENSDEYHSILSNSQQTEKSKACTSSKCQRHHSGANNQTANSSNKSVGISDIEETLTFLSQPCNLYKTDLFTKGPTWSSIKSNQLSASQKNANSPCQFAVNSSQTGNLSCQTGAKCSQTVTKQAVHDHHKCGGCGYSNVNHRSCQELFQFANERQNEASYESGYESCVSALGFEETNYCTNTKKQIDSRNCSLTFQQSSNFQRNSKSCKPKSRAGCITNSENTTRRESIDVTQRRNQCNNCEVKYEAGALVERQPNSLENCQKLNLKQHISKPVDFFNTYQYLLEKR